MATRWFIDLSSVVDSAGNAEVDVDFYDELGSVQLAVVSTNPPPAPDLRLEMIGFLQSHYAVTMFETPFGAEGTFLIESEGDSTDYPETSWGGGARQFAGAGPNSSGTMDFPLMEVPADVEAFASASVDCYCTLQPTWTLTGGDARATASGALQLATTRRVEGDARPFGAAFLELATPRRGFMVAAPVVRCSCTINVASGTVQELVTEILQLWGVQKWAHASCEQRSGAIAILNQAIQELWLRAKDRPYFTRTTKRLLLDRNWRTEWFSIQSVEGMAVNVDNETLQPASNRREGEMFARMWLGELAESGEPTAYVTEYDAINAGGDRTNVRIRLLPGSPAATLALGQWSIDVTDFVDNAGDCIADVQVWKDGSIAATVSATDKFKDELENILGAGYVVTTDVTPSPFEYIVYIEQVARGTEELPAFGGNVTSGNFVGIGSSPLALAPTELVEVVTQASPIISVDCHVPAPRIELTDWCANTRLDVPVQYVETLLMPLARYMAAQSYHFNAKDQLQVLQERYQSCRHLFDTADPSPKSAERQRAPHAGTTLQTTVTQTLP